MQEHKNDHCPECEGSVQLPTLDRRNFIRVLGGGVAALVAAGRLPGMLTAAEPTPKPAKPAEALIQEFYSTLTDKQKQTIALPWDHAPAKGAAATRLGMYNSPLNGQKIADIYTKPQQELIERTLRSILSGDEGFQRISRNGTWDNSKTLDGCGCHVFGEPVKGQKYAWLFTGHHLTLRCDGDSLEGAAWGGPMYYGHIVTGYSDKNVYYYQTKGVLEVYSTLDAKQREKAIVDGSPGEQARSVQFRKASEARPGIALAEMSAEQRALVEKVMRNLLAPYRKEDADEVMTILKTNGGLDKLHLAYYRDDKMNDNERWHFWRLEGPGFVWNYRVLPHVHCYVNIAVG
jgi:hypothetical protein